MLTMVGRKEAIQQVREKLEFDMELLGVTGVEDKYFIDKGYKMMFNRLQKV